MSETAASSHEEVPALFSAGEESLFGIHTHPTADAVGAAAIVVPGGGGTRISFNRNRFSVRLCRAVASLGYHAFRFDFHGAGESTGVAGPLRLDRPFVEDLEGAIRCVEQHGIEKFVLVGTCFGARTALEAAQKRPGVQGLILISAPVRDFGEGERVLTRMAEDLTIWGYARRAFRPEVIAGVLRRDRLRVYTKAAKLKWRSMANRAKRSGRTGTDSMVSPNFLHPIEELVAREVPMLFLYGDAEPAFEEFQRARRGRLGKVIQQAGRLVKIATVPGRVHGFYRMDVQEEVLRTILEWLRVEMMTAEGDGRDRDTAGRTN